MKGFAVSKETGGWVPVDSEDDVPEGFVFSKAQPDKCSDRNEDIERKRKLAYADPVTGSDRYLAEAMSKRVSGDEDAAKAAEAAHVVRKEQIRKELPWLT
ncbi:hypothetical protein [Pseudomonas costantinii]|uniref:Uncharacterized protein n=1 Tax=Pseudomonas costantinii TaxID=168469 RepID=A0A1S2UEC1_9PSED|nr:hypothetical protein [Pseudomonas costantinii]OIN44500.1 hypothetical protein BFL40_29880 [Pseudomonas costantinii]SED26178.1 hypothetical protein SAMN04515675_0469 [Pseudomonas costantinii]